MTELMKIEILLGTPPIPGEVLSVHLKTDRINPLTPVPAVTGRAKTHPQFPVPAVTGRKEAREV